MVMQCCGQFLAHMPQLMQDTLQLVMAALPFSRLLHCTSTLAVAGSISISSCGQALEQAAQPTHLL